MLSWPEYYKPARSPMTCRPLLALFCLLVLTDWVFSLRSVVFARFAALGRDGALASGPLEQNSGGAEALQVEEKASACSGMLSC